MEYRTTRDITKEECPWLNNDIRKGTLVHSYHFPTYGCISQAGRAFSMEDGEGEFFELPNNAVAEKSKRFGFGSSWSEESGHIGVHIFDEEKQSIYVSLRDHNRDAIDPYDVPAFVHILDLLNNNAPSN